MIGRILEHYAVRARSLAALTLVLGLVLVLVLKRFCAGPDMPPVQPLPPEVGPVGGVAPVKADPASSAKERHVQLQKEWARVDGECQSVLKWLLSTQQQDGRWLADAESDSNRDLLVTSLACLAITGSSNYMGKPERRSALCRACAWISSLDPPQRTDLPAEMMLALSYLAGEGPTPRIPRADMYRIRSLLSAGAERGFARQGTDGSWLEPGDPGRSALVSTCAWAVAVREMYIARHRWPTADGDSPQDGALWNIPDPVHPLTRDWLMQQFQRHLDEKGQVSPPRTPEARRRVLMLMAALAAVYKSDEKGSVGHLMLDCFPKPWAKDGARHPRILPEDYDLYGFFLQIELVAKGGKIEELTELYAAFCESVMSTASKEGHWTPPEKYPDGIDGLRVRGKVGQTALAICIISTYQDLVFLQIRRSAQEQLKNSGK